ncbi:class I SAM-dependent methyltransferase [Polynucleobacter paneuropaeus]|nr:class I SAM-dependent methyltransferase [Polynucleobacter paneuropaeus]
MNLTKHLKLYGIHHFDDDSYWEWAGSLLHQKIGDNGLDKLDRLRLPLQSDNTTTKDRQVFYNYISDFRFSGVIHSLKAGAIEASGSKVNCFTSNKNKILDFGCNIGYLTTWYALSNPSSEIFGFDVNRKSIDTAKLFATKIGIKNIQFNHGNINKLSNQFFDLVIDTQSIFENVDKFVILQQIFQSLTESGTFLSIPQAGNLHEFVGYCELLKLAGFHIESIEPLIFSDLGIYSGYGVFVCNKSKGMTKEINSRDIFEDILELVTQKNDR